MDIVQETVSEFTTGHGTVGTASQSLVAAGFARKAYKGVTVRASVANTGLIYVGSQGVEAANGYPLPAGDSVEIPVDDPSKVYVIADAVGQDYSWIAA